MKEKEVLSLLEEIMELEENELERNTDLTNIEDWDSLAVLSFIAMIKKRYNLMIKSEDMRKVKTVSDIMNLVQ